MSLSNPISQASPSVHHLEVFTCRRNCVIISVSQEKHADVFSLDMTLGEDGGIIRTLYRVVVGSEGECVIHLFPTQEGQSSFVNTLTKNGYNKVIVEINEGSTIERGKHLVAEGAKIAGKIVFGAVMKEVIKSLVFS